jgi:hypothetical protein
MELQKLLLKESFAGLLRLDFAASSSAELTQTGIEVENDVGLKMKRDCPIELI